MIRRRAAAAVIRTNTGSHTIRATGLTEYLRNGGELEIAHQMANHESARTTGPYGRRGHQVSLDAVGRILSPGTRAGTRTRHGFGACNVEPRYQSTVMNSGAMPAAAGDPGTAVSTPVLLSIVNTRIPFAPEEVT